MEKFIEISFLKFLYKIRRIIRQDEFVLRITRFIGERFLSIYFNLTSHQMQRQIFPVVLSVKRLKHRVKLDGVNDTQSYSSLPAINRKRIKAM